MSIATQIRALALDRTAIASALEDKGVDTAGHGFDDFAADIANIPDEQVYCDGMHGLAYTKNTILGDIHFSGISNMYRASTHMETLEYRYSGVIGGSATHSFVSRAFSDCPNLRSVRFPFYKGTGLSGYADAVFTNSPLSEFVAGSIGHPLDDGNTLANTGIYSWFNTSNPMTITIYLAAERLSDVPATYTSRQPWGAPNATVVYRNAATGEVLE